MSPKHILFVEVVKVELSLLRCLGFSQDATQLSRETQCTVPGSQKSSGEGDKHHSAVLCTVPLRSDADVGCSGKK